MAFHLVSKCRNRALDRGAAGLELLQRIALAFGRATLGDVFVSAYPSTVLDRTIPHGDQAPIGRLDLGAGEFAVADGAQQLIPIFADVTREAAGGFAVF